MNASPSPTATASLAASIVFQILFASSFAFAEDLVGKTDVTFNWAAASGPVFEYAVFVNRNGSGFPETPEKIVSTTSANLSGSYGDVLTIRVAARDDKGVQGPFSPNSDVIRFVKPPPVLSLSTTSLTASVRIGENPPNQAFTIRNTGDSTLEYTITVDQPWLSLTPTSGTATTETDTISVSINAKELSVGAHHATITVNSTGLASQSIDVELIVTAAPGALSLNKASISAKVKLGFDAADQSFVLRNSGGSTASYTVTSNAEWAIVSPSGGTLSASATQTISIDLRTENLSAGGYSATITVQMTEGEAPAQHLTLNLVVTEPLGIPGKPIAVLKNRF